MFCSKPEPRPGCCAVLTPKLCALALCYNSARAAALPYICPWLLCTGRRPELHLQGSTCNLRKLAWLPGMRHDLGGAPRLALGGLCADSLDGLPGVRVVVAEHCYMYNEEGSEEESEEEDRGMGSCPSPPCAP